MIHEHCLECFNLNKCAKKPSNQKECPVISCSLECGRIFHACKLDEHRHLCINEQVPCLNSGYGCPFRIYRHLLSSHLSVCPASVVLCNLKLDHWPLYPLNEENSENLCIEKAERQEKDIWNKSFLDVTIASDIASSVMSYYSPWKSYEAFRVNPIHSYTFVCAQAFRRDEYHWHYKNIHNDIHCSLHGLIVQWCPLVQYGCKFSRRGIYPAPAGSLVVYNEIAGAFGVVPHSSPINGDETFLLKQPNVENGHCSSSGCDTYEKEDMLSILPYEILQKIAHNLDSFSLGNLALTSRHLRNVCNSLLEDRGIVVIQWKKVEREEKPPKWEVEKFRWFFSKGITPVTRWRYLDGKNISDHMQGCPFNEKKMFKEEHQQRCKLFDPFTEY